MVTARRITANTSFFMVALIFQKLLSFVYFTILARSLGAEGTGQYFFAISFATMFSVLIDLGLSPVLIREVSKDEGNGQRWFSQVFTLKIWLALATAIILTLLNTWIFYSDAVRNLIYLTTLIIIIDSFTLLFYAYIRGRQSLKFESWGVIIFQIIVLAMGLSLLRITNNVFVLLTVLLVASTFNMFFSGFILRFKYKVKFRFLYSKEFVKKIIIITLPFALSAIFARIYGYIDTFLLKMFLGDAQVGFYGVAYKITFALQFIPLAFVAALYPAFSNYFKTDRQKLERSFVKSFNYLAFIAIPVTFGVIALANEVVSKLYTSEFSMSIFPLQILIASIPFLFVNFSLSSFLNATNRQKINTRNLGVIMVFNIIINLFLIPKLGVWGASLASTVSTIFLFSFNLWAVLQVVKLKSRMFKPLLGTILSSIIMFVLVYWIKDYIHWALAMLVGIVVYFVLMLITKTLKKEDILFVKNSVFKSQ